MNFFQLPIGAGANDPVVGEVDGAKIRMAPNGTRYYEQYTPPAEAKPSPLMLQTTLDAQGRASHDRVPNTTRDKVKAMLAPAEGLLSGIAQGFTAPGRAARGEPVTYGDAWATALDYGALSAPTEAPAGSLRIFAGRNAKTADMDALARAEAMTAEGADRGQIWRDTGWYKGVDDQWRFEIDDSAASVPMENRYTDYDAPLGMYAEHDALFDAYPDATFMGVDQRAPTGSGIGAFYESPDDFGSMFISKDAPDPATVMIHEGQHAVQNAEGFARGGAPGEYASGPMFDKRATALNRDWGDALTGRAGAPSETASLVEYGEPSEMLKIAHRHGFDDVASAVDFLKKQDEMRTPYSQYHRTAGEVEARNAQLRRYWTPEMRRDSPPWETMDVPEIEQIVRKDGIAQGYGALSAPTSAPEGALRSGGIKAYHGSPHDFDRFSMDKIGTGEGAQDMGRGLYFYDDQGSAELYRNPAARWGDLDAMKGYEAFGPSHVYEVNIDATPEQFLDADAPASSLPSGGKLAARRDAKIAGESDPDFAQTMREHMKVQNIIRGAERDVLDDGFKGIKRKRYGGETEFAVFDEDLIEIVRKYGIAGAATYLGMPREEIEQRMGGA